MNNKQLYNHIINKVAKIVKKEINEAFDFSKFRDTIKVDQKSNSERLINSVKAKARLDNPTCEELIEIFKLFAGDNEIIDETISGNTITNAALNLNGQYCLDYHHFGLRFGLDYWPIPFDFSIINYGRKNDRDMVRHGAYHITTLIKALKDKGANAKCIKEFKAYLETAENDTKNLCYIKISKNGEFIAAIDNTDFNKDRHAVWKIWLTKFYYYNKITSELMLKPEYTK